MVEADVASATVDGAGGDDMVEVLDCKGCVGFALASRRLEQWW